MDLNELRVSLAKIAQGDYDKNSSIDDYLRSHASNDERRMVLQEAEYAIKQIAGELDCLPRWSGMEMDSIEMLVGVRNYALDLMMQPTCNEVRRLEQQNDILLRRTLDLYNMERQFLYLTHEAGELADDCDLDAELKYMGCEPDEWLHMDEDEYYGSDFGYMLNLQPMLHERKHCYNIIEIASGDLLDDGTSWAEGTFLCRPEFSHICVCHALHSLCTHVDYPIPDVLRMNNFYTEITLKYERDESFARER